MLTPGRFVGAKEVEDDNEPFEEKMRGLVMKLEEQFTTSANLGDDVLKTYRGWDMGNSKKVLAEWLEIDRLEECMRCNHRWFS